MLDEINNYTNYTFSAIIGKVKTRNKFRVLMLKGEIKEVKESRYSEYYSALSIRSKFVTYLRQSMPKIYKALKKIEEVVLWWNTAK